MPDLAWATLPIFARAGKVFATREERDNETRRVFVLTRTQG
jgi:hypothetical protein